MPAKTHDRRTVFLVEDNDDIRFLVTTSLMREGYHVVACETGQEVSVALPQQDVDLVLLDLMLPDINGIELIDDIRSQTQAPILILSAKSQLVERVVGLEAGADDYIAKPFQIEELIARVRAHIRRYKNQHQIYTQKQIRFDRCVMDLYAHRVSGPDGQDIPLTASEFDLLKTLVAAPGRAFTREQLLNHCRSDNFDITERVIDTQIARIRKKMADVGCDTGLIRSVRGVGYAYQGSRDS